MTTLSPAELRMTPDELRKAATECRTIAQGLRQRAVQVSTANLAAAAANPATALARATTAVCSGDLPNSIDNMAAYLEQHADALDAAAARHDAEDAETADEYRRVQGTTGTRV